MKQYIYEVEEWSNDIRKFEIVSDRKLTYNEVMHSICLPDISKEGDCETDNGVTTTYLYTDFGEDGQIIIEGEELKEDNEWKRLTK